MCVKFFAFCFEKLSYVETEDIGLGKKEDEDIFLVSFD